MMENKQVSDTPEIAQLKIYNDAYRRGDPLVPDAVYDEMYKREKEKHPEHEFFNTVQPEIIKNAVKLPYMMGSLSNHDKTTVGNWLKKHPCEGGYIASHKLDGVSFTLVYEDGELVLGASRGKGNIGQNMTEKAKVFAPKITYGGTVVVRGECLLNCDPESIGYNTRRNAVAGIMSRDDNEKLEYVMFKAFEILQANEMPQYVSDQMNFMKTLGFDVASWVHIPNEYIDKIPMILENMVNKFQNDENRPYDIDGAVLCTDDYTHEETSYPKGKIAFKREEEIYTSQCTKVLWDVSRLGRHIPVACYEPIKIGGAMFERATAHHASVIALYGIKPGKVIKICRAKEVIPMVVTDAMDQEPDYSLLPTNCVSCNSTLMWDSNKVHLVCVENNCPTKMLKKVTHFFICLGLKEFTLSSFKSLGLDTIEKACTITKEEIMAVDGWGETSAQQFVDGIQACMNPTMTQFITALGIDSIGTKMASHIAPLAEGDMKQISRIGSTQIAGLPLVADKRCNQIMAGLHESAAFIRSCERFITIRKEEDTSVSEKLAGKKFCLTGKMSKPRAEIQDMIAANGGINASGLSKPSTSPYQKNYDQYLVTNEESTSSKYNKALAFGIPIITEEQLMEMINS